MKLSKDERDTLVSEKVKRLCQELAGACQIFSVPRP